MWVIVQRPYDHLLNELRGVYKDQTEVVVKVDSRQGERRRGEYLSQMSVVRLTGEEEKMRLLKSLLQLSETK